MDIKICKMTPKFAQEVSEIGLITKEFQYDLEKNTTYSVDDIKRAIKNNDTICLVAIVKNHLAGFIIRTFHPFFNEDYLSEIFVKDRYRKNGIAQLLIDESRKIMKSRGVEWTWSLVQTKNKRMQRFLEKNGFKRGKPFYFYYKDGI